MRKSTFVDPLLQHPDRRHSLIALENGSVVASQVEAAFDSSARRRGLLGRHGMPEGEALIIAPCNGVHTFFMRFAIDVVFVARDGGVLKTCRRVRPWRIAVAWNAFAVIEGAAGFIERSGVRPGRRVALLPADAHSE